MAEILERELTNNLIYVIDEDSDSYHSYISPIKIKNKIIIKGKGKLREVYQYKFPNLFHKRFEQNQP